MKQRREMIQHLLSRGFQVDPDTLEDILTTKIDLDTFLTFVEQVQPEIVVISKSLLLRFQASLSQTVNQTTSERVEIEKIEEKDEVIEINNQIPFEKLKRPNLPIEILTQIPFRTEARGELTDFLALFKDRYIRLRHLLLSRPEVRSAIEVNKARHHPEGDVIVVGMLDEKRLTPQGGVVLNLEDLSGQILPIIISPQKKSVEEARFLFTDTVIGISGFLKDANTDIDYKRILFGNEIIKPGVPNYAFRLGHSYELGCMAITGDLHVGSIYFEESLWKAFVKFLNQEIKEPKYKALAARLSHLLIPGDLVDGVGVFPDQEDELEILNIYEQYNYAAELLAEIPQDIQIVICPGNHDASRQAIPQQIIPKNFCEKLQSMKNIIMVANPAFFKLGPRKILIYHGQGLERVIQQTKATFERPDLALIEILKYRHLFPLYGTKSAIAPERKDYLVIDDLPEIIVTGHLHIGKTRIYRGLRLALSGTFEQASSWLRGLNIQPTVGLVPIVDLASGELFEYQVQ
ncbi:MAG: metallophosphoesterase [Promethearchaeota archaeon]